MSARLRVSMLALVVFGGCARCGSDDAVAELTTVAGVVEADDAADPVAFVATEVGRRFVIGEAVRTGPAATANLALAGGGTLHVDPDSVVRFAREQSPESPVQVDVEQGSTTVEAADAPIEVETVFGVAHLDARTRTRIGPSGARFEVVVGHARLDPRDRASIALETGGSIDRAGRSTAPSAPPPSAPPASTANAADVAMPAPDGTTRSIDVHGAGARVQRRGETEFSPIGDGRAQVPEGSSLRTDRDTTIDIQTADGRIRMEGGSEVQLHDARTRAARGTFSLEGGNETRLEVPGGAIVLSAEEGTSSARVALEQGGNASVSVLSGSAVEETADGDRVLHAAEAEAETDTSAARTPSPSDVAAPVSLTAGDSAVVHNPSAPTRVRIDAPAGCEPTEWRLDNRVRPLAASLVLELRAGAHRYALRCASGVRESGNVRVDRDRGVTPMSRVAPRTVVDADGRPYSVLYQTLLPEILFRWPHPTGSAPYEIEVQHGGATRRIPSATTSHTFGSGETVEGSSTLTFRAADGSRSPPTTVHIRFDNATPVASIRSPAPGAHLTGATHVEGTVAEGASVSVAGISIPVDRSERFSSDVAAPTGGCLAVRVALPGRGVHYYVRCDPSR